MAPLVALCTGGVDVRLDLGFEGAGEHPPRSLSSDLVEIEHEPFADFIVLMYPFHRCASSSSKSLEKVHHALQGILDPQLLSISPTLGSKVKKKGRNVIVPAPTIGSVVLDYCLVVKVQLYGEASASPVEDSMPVE